MKSFLAKAYITFIVVSLVGIYSSTVYVAGMADSLGLRSLGLKLAKDGSTPQCQHSAALAAGFLTKEKQPRFCLPLSMMNTALFVDNILIADLLDGGASPYSNFWLVDGGVLLVGEDLTLSVVRDEEDPSSFTYTPSAVHLYGDDAVRFLSHHDHVDGGVK